MSYVITALVSFVVGAFCAAIFSGPIHIKLDALHAKLDALLAALKPKP